jgi:hypothetical protein
MKKVILSSVLAAAAIGAASSANAQATTTPTAFCSGVAGNGIAASPTTAGGFVITVFTPKCSQNVFLAGSDNSTFYRVGAGSSKGKNRFAGSTMGGGIASAGACAVTGCSASDATSSLTSGATS